MSPVVSLVGGGVSTAALLALLPDALVGDRLEIRLAAQDLDRLEIIAAHGRAVVASRPGWSVTACRTAVEASAGADVVVLMLRIGGLAARRADEQRARAFGIPGDEGLGPGGAANALRTLPPLADLADHLLDVAPSATVLNLVAPLGLTTRLLLDRGLDAVGVCELPAVTEAELRAAVGESVELAYAGLNHLGWFWPAEDRSSPALDRLAPLVAAGLVDAAVLSAFGAVPLKYYYWLLDPPAAARLGITREPGRTDHLIELRDRAVAELAAAPGADSPALAGRPMPWFAHGLVPMLAAVLDGRPWRGFANVRNDDLVPGIDPDVVVETRATSAHGRLLPLALRDPMPPTVRAFVERTAVAEDRLYRAWRDDDPTLLVDSLADGPHQLDRSSARRLADAIRQDARRPVGAPR